MNTRPVKTTILLGSIRQERLADSILAWVNSTLEGRPDLSLSVLDPREIGLTPWHGDMDPAALAGLRAALAQSEGFLVVTPEYNHSYPAPLKAMIDAGKDEWARKPVGFVSYGGLSGGLRAVEHLRCVFAELRSHTLRDTVSIANPWVQIDEGGTFAPPEASQAALDTQINDYLWWARLLRTGREIV